MSEKKTRVKESFNPIKEDKDGIKAKRAIWSTRAIDLAFEGLKQGRKLVANPFYENNTKLLNMLIKISNPYLNLSHISQDLKSSS